MKTTLMFIYTESSLHAGTGSSVSIVDLPIQRERATQYPIVQGSGMKGALRSQAEGTDDEKTIVFGPIKDGAEHAGAISVGEAQLLLFPVRSLAGVFAWVTSAFAVARLRRDLGYAQITPTWSDIDASGGKALITNDSKVIVEGSAVLEEFTFPTQVSAEVTKLAGWLAENAFPEGAEYKFWRDKVRSSLIVLPENDFRDFVVNSTEIVTRVRLDSATKTVQTGALWTQEMLPSDALLYSSVVVRKARKGDGSSDEIAAWLSQNIPTRIQLGGDETTGAGMVALQWTK